MSTPLLDIGYFQVLLFLSKTREVPASSSILTDQPEEDTELRLSSKSPLLQMTFGTFVNWGMLGSKLEICLCGSGLRNTSRVWREEQGKRQEQQPAASRTHLTHGPVLALHSPIHIPTTLQVAPVSRCPRKACQNSSAPCQGATQSHKTGNKNLHSLPSRKASEELLSCPALRGLLSLMILDDKTSRGNVTYCTATQQSHQRGRRDRVGRGHE